MEFVNPFLLLDSINHQYKNLKENFFSFYDNEPESLVYIGNNRFGLPVNRCLDLYLYGSAGSIHFYCSSSRSLLS